MSNLQRISLEEGSEKIINGELVIFPTETVGWVRIVRMMGEKNLLM